MSEKLVMPKAGLTMVEGTIAGWKVREGETVHKGQVVFEYENEKTAIECESTGGGIIHLIAAEGDVVKVGEVVALLAADQAEYEVLCGQQPVQRQAAAPVQAVAPPSGTNGQGAARVRASGLAKAMAREKGIDLHAVTGTGPGGRIVAKDLSGLVPGTAASVPPEGEVVKTVLTGHRKTVAKNMHDSLSQMAQSTAVTEVDVTDLMALRQKLVEKQELLGTKITLNDLFVKLVVKVLQKNPGFNSTFDGDTIYTYPSVNMGIAVGADCGLMVPVLRRAETMTLTQISKSIKEMARRAREGSLSNGEQGGGTFTISNVGMFPIDSGTPVINPPQVALLGFGRPVKKLVEYQGEFCGRTMLHLMLTFDHRVFDGLEVGRMMQDLKEFIENPELICV